MLKKTISPVFIFLLLAGFTTSVAAQPTWTIDPFGKQKKPEKFENRKLGSEKTADKKFTVPRNFYQNTITHYNYFYNANNRVNAVVERAKMSAKDDYSNLLSFYPYSLESTSTQKSDLDSVIYTSTAGILLHDLRNDWIDNMYMLIGKAYFLRKDFDSALMTFQFINYNLFPRKRKNDNDDRVVGTNSAASGNSISIANKEKRNILQKVTAKPPSRNDALIWLTRTLIEQNEFAESGGLINTLQNDPNLPKRLRNDLDEVTAYWFFKQASYDSAAVHLEKALSNADTKQDKSRWEFLLAQLYEMSGSYDKASDYYDKASRHTVDPLLDIYARLNEAKMMKGATDPKQLDKSINNLVKMGRKDKFEAYRDIVYYSAGQLALQKPDTNAAIAYFNKSLKYNEDNINYKNRAYLQLGDIAYERKQYRLAAAMYDSLKTGADSILDKQIARVQDRKNALTKIAEAISNIEREDSLQRIALMQPAEREDYIKKLVRKLRKEKGLKDDGSGGNDIIPFGNNTQQQTDLFAGNTRGEWYFYNSSLKSRGFSEFKSRWGNRANVDNWRRKASMEKAAANPVANTKNPAGTNSKDSASKNAAAQNTEISYDAMVSNLPLTPEKLASSNDIIADNLFELAKLYQNDLEEYRFAIDTYEEYLKRFPDKLRDGEVYLGLYYCYTKLGDKAKADSYKDLLNNKFPNSKSGQILTNPAAANPQGKNPAVTKLYEDIYNLFIEGDFEKAISEKRKADSLYGVNYWTPQLLYIEALHHVKNREDSIAIVGLESIMAVYPTSPLKEKAETMISVLRRRAEIEKYLTNLEVTRAEDDKPIKIPDSKPQPVNKPITPAPVKADSVKKAPAPLTNGTFTMALSAPHHVMMILDKVDQVYVTEAKNAFGRYNRENYSGQVININKDVLDNDRSLLLFSTFPDAATALQYYEKIKRNAASEISWLPANKYSFLIITDENLQLLKTNKNITGYKDLLNTQFPNRF